MPPDSPDRRQQILSAALEAFIDKGYDKSSMDDVVRISGLSKGTLYWYFKSKSDLFAAVIIMITDQMLSSFDEILEQTDVLSPPDALRSVLDGLVRVLDMNPDFYSLNIDFMLQALHDENVRRAYTAYYVRYFDAISRIIKRGVDEGHFRPIDVHLFAAGFVSALDGMALLSLLEKDINDLHHETLDIRAVIHVAGNVMIRGLMKDETHEG